MNVTINRAEMLSAIKRASAVAPADSPLDVLRGVLLEADAAARKLTVTSTNLEAALEEKLPCTVQEDGALVFGAKMLAEMLSRLPQDTVQLCRAENQGRMTLRSGDACYEVDVWERGAFPKPDLPFPEDTVKLSGIPAMAQHTVFATAQDNSKPLLKCVNLMFTSTGLRAAGSNGNCIVTARGDNQSTGDVSLLIPAASLGKLSNMCQDKDEFRVGTTGKSIVFFRENFLFSARFHPAGYLNYEELFFILRKLRPCNSSAGIEEAVTRRCCPRLPLYLYHSRFSISRNAFFTKCSFTGMKCRKTLPESKKLSAVSLCRFLTNRHEKGFPDGKPFQFTILHPVRM